MALLVYIRLIGLTAGTLAPLFWMVVILAYRRQRNFERVFFFLCLALFLFYSGSLLALNAQIHYGEPPVGLREFAITIITVGLCLVPGLLMHLHMEFAETRGLLRNKRWKFTVLLLFYAASVHLAIRLFPIRITGARFDFVQPANSLGEGFAHLYTYSLLWCAVWEFRFCRNAANRPERRFYGFLSGVFAAACLGIVSLHVLHLPLSPSAAQGLGVALAMLPVAPLGALIYLVWRHNFLQIGRQKNLVYAVSATFMALLYLSLVRRVSGWLEPVLPPEASASILLFVLVPFIEPLQRILGRTLEETAHRELDRVQGLGGEIQQEAKQGDVAALVRFIEHRVAEEFELALARVVLTRIDRERPLDRTSSSLNGANFGETMVANTAGADSPNRFRIGRGDQDDGFLLVQPHGAFLSGETVAALEFLCEQLPNALELCLLIEEKLRLERELAERERLAVLGQMAASISHNLKNPLGSIKTILQVQMENPELPAAIRGETKIVLDEVGRLSAKLNQLLQFSRPAVRSGTAGATCDLRTVIEEVVGVLRHEAERRGVRLGSRISDGDSRVEASAEALNEVISNLVVNALEATSRGGQVNVEVSWRGNRGAVISVTDDGMGIPAALQGKVVRPFFTTKPQGTGLGLAIVARRVAEIGGKLEWVSPAREGKGTRFEVTLLPARANEQKDEGGQ
jgi:signal transduction histidine kinase